MEVKLVTPKYTYELIQGGGDIELIDVRTPAEYADFHASGAVLLPLNLLDPIAFVAERESATKKPVYILCKTSVRASHACEMLLAAGAKDVFVVEGGTIAWAESGLPIEFSDQE